MMSRTVLLLVTTALALIAAGGIALAATFTCTTNPCDGTTDNDVISGTASAETINGKAGNDYLYGGDGDNNLIGDNGADWLHGEAGNDELDAGSDFNADYYVFGADWGSDTITDGGGNADEVRGNTPSLADPPWGT
jgi:Ca2+-binding RTX toxin-like protein